MNSHNQEFINTYLAINANKYPKEALTTVTSILHRLNESQQAALHALPIKDPTLALLLSFFFGSFAVDRFYIGNILLGILKLITIGGLGIWTVIDWFIISKQTRQQNLDLLLKFADQL